MVAWVAPDDDTTLQRRLGVLSTMLVHSNTLLDIVSLGPFRNSVVHTEPGTWNHGSSTHGVLLREHQALVEAASGHLVWREPDEDLP
eukprot:3642211-Rhodomonas_salina.6